MSTIEIKKSVCTFCKGECGVLVHVQDGHLVKVEEDPEWLRKVYPPTRGCPRLKSTAEFFYHPKRVNFPLKRAGERGEGKWKQITWDQAFDEIAEKIDRLKTQFGPEAIASTRGTSYKGEFAIRNRFYRLLGTPLNEIGSQCLCFIPRSILADAIVGMFPHFSVTPQTKCIVHLGVEPLISRPITAYNIIEAQKNGARSIVIDPRRTRSASRADVWLQLRPGTDCALLMGMINFIINENLYDRNFVDKYCYGFDQLKERAREYSLEQVARITEVPAEKIAEAATVYATNKPGAMVEGMGIEELQSNAQVLHARWILASLVGNIDVEGGEELSGPHPLILNHGQLEPKVEVSQEQRRKALGSDRFKMLTWQGQDIISRSMKRTWGRPLEVASGASHPPSVLRAMSTGQPYPVRAAITFGNNCMVASGNSKLVYQSLKSLDLYAVCDYWMTPCAELADYVLPGSHWAERPMLWDFNSYSPYMIAGEAALPHTIPGEYDHKEDFAFFRELGIRLGQEKYWPWKTLEEYYDALVKPTGMTHNEYVHKVRCERKPVAYKKYEKVGFGTPTGKAELYSTVHEQLGYDPLPRYQEPNETRVGNPELAKEYPLTLITGGRIIGLYHSEFRQIDSVRRLRPNPVVQIHPETAKQHGIKQGDWVWIENKRGRVRQTAELFDGIKPDVVHAEHSWWFPELPGEEPSLHGVWQSNINVLTDDDPDVCNQVTGAWPLRTTLCKIYRAETGPGQ
ncbi:MAG: molybdopterin-dependent oxidoreductase [Chloroflexi bacterium]|nr:molybdopterin-dependent oxidoreductase [Chloroflexota bacterium]